MAQPVTGSRAQPVRALIVEDDPSWQQILSEILTDSGLEVDIAAHYEAAVERLRGSSHRLAVLDLSLGGSDHNNQDGLRVAEAVRRHDPGCTILFLTGFATVELAVQVMQEQGAFSCLRKEVFKRSEFRKVVSQALARPPAPMPPPPAGDEASRRAGAAPVGPVQPAAVALVVDDDAGWRSVLTELLQDAGFQVRTSSSYVDAFGLVRRERFALAVVDLSLASSLTDANLDGYRLLNTTQKAGIPTMVVSGNADPERIEKAYAENQLYACLEKQSFDRKAFRALASSARAGEGTGALLQSLTDREREVLVLLASGLTNKEIARALTITPNTVKRHLKSLFSKLDVNTRSAASAMAISMGVDPQARK